MACVGRPGLCESPRACRGRVAAASRVHLGAVVAQASNEIVGSQLLLWVSSGHRQDRAVRSRDQKELGHVPCVVKPHKSYDGKQQQHPQHAEDEEEIDSWWGGHTLSQRTRLGMLGTHAAVVRRLTHVRTASITKPVILAHIWAQVACLDQQDTRVDENHDELNEDHQCTIFFSAMWFEGQIQCKEQDADQKRHKNTREL
eukprot:3400177-Prymnesium_polylepis.3